MPDTDEPSSVSELDRRYGAHMERFTRIFPDSAALRSITGDPEDPATIIEALEAQLPERPDDVSAALETLYQAVDAGDAPVGAVAAIVGRSHLPIVVAGTNRSVPTIPDERRLGNELAAARNLLNGDVIVDVSTLASLSLTPGAWPLLAAAIGRLSIVSTQRQDVEVYASQPAPIAHTIRTSAGIRVIEASDDDIRGTRARLDWIRARAAELAQETPASEAPLTELRELEEVGVWAHALHAAHATGRPLLCDDVGLADLARRHGVKSCGSFALLVAGMQEGFIDESEIDTHLRVCFERLVVDLPILPSVMVGFASALEEPTHPLLGAISRPAYWRKAGAGATYQTVVETVLAQDRELIWVLTAATLSGSSRALPAHAAYGFTAAVLTHLAFAARVDPSEFRAMVEAMRASWKLGGDPLPLLISSIATTMAEDGHDGQTISDFIIALSSVLDSSDQALVARTVLLGDSS